MKLQRDGLCFTQLNSFGVEYDIDRGSKFTTTTRK